MREREMGLFAGSIATYGLWTNSRWRRLVSIRDAVSTALSYSPSTSIMEEVDGSRSIYTGL
jgi:hypothetical protein